MPGFRPRHAFRLLTAAILVTAPAVAQTASLAEGQVRGEVLDEAAGLRVFRGIPYAAAPVGARRWQPPQPVAAWEGARDATSFGSICPQPPMLAAMTGEKLPASDEDCLFLNVWTTAPADAKQPVMVWIHGGGLNLGWSNQTVYDGAAFARRGVVLVSINYRLGPLGFLSLPELSQESPRGVSGNYGLRDQIAALQWVQRNIAAFGGDPGNVTIFGESAGGTSIHALLTAAGTEGLYQRAISESAWVTEANIVPLREPSPFAPSAEQIGEAWARKLVGEDGDTSLAALRSVPAEEIIAKTGAAFQPVIAVDGDVEPLHGEVAFAQGRFRHVPLIAGTNADEGTMFMAGLGYGDAEAYREGLHKTYGAGADAVLAIYPPPADGGSLNDTLNRYLTDAWFLRATRRMLLGSQAAGSPTFQYHFTRRSKAMPAWGAHHANELSYVFNNPGGLGGPAAPWDETDKRLAAAMIGYWVQFAKTGDPNVEGLPAWPRFEAGSERYLELGDRIEAGSNLCAGRCEALGRVLSAAWAAAPTSGR